MKKSLNSNILKLIAIIAMTIDHIMWVVFPNYSYNPIVIILHIIGRLTCPIMCYFIAEGFHYSKNINKYTLRLFIFALISHIPYVAFSIHYIDYKSFIPFYYGSIFDQTSVIWSLFCGLLMLRIHESEKIKHTSIKVLLILLLCVIAFPSNWSCIGSLCILAFGTNRNNFKVQMLWMIFYVFLYALVYFIFLDKVYGILQMGVILAIPILYMYNGKRGSNPKINKIAKWLFYIYYPLHLIILALF